MGFSNTKFVSDHWHLFNQVFPNAFGRHLAEKLSPHLTAMVYSRSEEEFLEVYNDCKTELTSGTYVRQHHLDNLSKLFRERQTYSNYCISKIQSSRGRKGSTSSESNHSSLIIHLNGARSVNSYKERPLTLVKDVLERQAKHIVKWNRSLFNEDREMRLIINKLSSTGEESNLKEAAKFLCKRSYQRFVDNWHRAKNEYSLVGGNKVQFLNCTNAKLRIFNQRDDGSWIRCGCQGQIAFEEQCVHEIVLHGCRFKKDLFASWHKRRSNVTSSPIPSHMKRMEERNLYYTATLVQTDSDDEEDLVEAEVDNTIPHEEWCDNTIPHEEWSVTRNKSKATNYTVTHNDFFRVQKEFNGCLRNCEYAVLEKLFAIQLEMLEIAKFNSSSETTMMSARTIDECFNSIVSNYKKAFVPSGCSFSSTAPMVRNSGKRLSEPPSDVQRRQPSKRLKSFRERAIDSRRSRVKTKNVSHCSFCSSTSHVITGCPKKEQYSLESRMTELSLKNALDLNCKGADESLIESIQSGAIIIERDDITGVVKYLTPTQESRNIILKQAIRVKGIPHSKDNERPRISSLVFACNFLNDFGEPDEEMTLITGLALKTYIRNAAKKRGKKTYVFDQTYKKGNNGNEKGNSGTSSEQKIGNSIEYAQDMSNNPMAQDPIEIDNRSEEPDWFDATSEYFEDL